MALDATTLATQLVLLALDRRRLSPRPLYIVVYSTLYSLLFSPARIYSDDKIKLISAQRNDSMQ